MKKACLLLFAFLPLFSSCDKEGTFANPFPNDSYRDKKIGFNIANDEKIERSLTTDEKDLVLSTFNKPDIYDAKIYTMASERHVRNYTRAFAGEYKYGFDVSNIMKDEKITINRQDQTGESPAEEKYRARTRTKNEYSIISQFSYGEVTDNVLENDYVYYFNASQTSTNKEASSKLDATSLNIRMYKNVNKYETVVDSGEKVTKSDTEKTGKWTDEEEAACNNYLYIRQSSYISVPDIKSGVKGDDIILIKTSQEKHVDEVTGKSGIFSLKDGRSYQAIDNKITVTKLKTEKDTNKWCRADYVRDYKETVITSKVIQPNVSIEKLKNPVTISYTEEIMHFYTNKVEISESIPAEK